jgi:hypothetical protein
MTPEQRTSAQKAGRAQLKTSLRMADGLIKKTAQSHEFAAANNVRMTSFFEHNEPFAYC